MRHKYNSLGKGVSQNVREGGHSFSTKTLRIHILMYRKRAISMECNKETSCITQTTVLPHSLPSEGCSEEKRLFRSGFETARSRYSLSLFHIINVRTVCRN
jgi:hypothetical protein